MSIPPVDGYVMVLQPEEPRISLSGVHHFARAASEFESAEGVSLFPELRIISTITREVEPEGDGAEDPTGNSLPRGRVPGWLRPRGLLLEDPQVVPATPLATVTCGRRLLQFKSPWCRRRSYTTWTPVRSRWKGKS